LNDPQDFVSYKNCIAIKGIMYYRAYSNDDI
jgi:hypothetical protein